MTQWGTAHRAKSLFSSPLQATDHSGSSVAASHCSMGYRYHGDTVLAYSASVQHCCTTPQYTYRSNEYSTAKSLHLLNSVGTASDAYEWLAAFSWDAEEPTNDERPLQHTEFRQLLRQVPLLSWHSTHAMVRCKHRGVLGRGRSQILSSASARATRSMGVGANVYTTSRTFFPLIQPNVTWTP